MSKYPKTRINANGHTEFKYGVFADWTSRPPEPIRRQPLSDWEKARFLWWLAVALFVLAALLKATGH